MAPTRSLASPALRREVVRQHQKLDELRRGLALVEKQAAYAPVLREEWVAQKAEQMVAAGTERVDAALDLLAALLRKRDAATERLHASERALREATAPSDRVPVLDTGPPPHDLGLTHHHAARAPGLGLSHPAMAELPARA